MVDGEPSKLNDLRAEDWAPGVHYITFPEGKENASAQALVHVVDPIEMHCDGDALKVPYPSDEPGTNGNIVDVEFTNLTDDEQSVVIEVLSAPAGWDAFVVGPPVVFLEPLGSSTTSVQIELMSTLGVRRRVPPVVIGARLTVITPNGEKVATREILLTHQLRLTAAASDEVLDELEKIVGRPRV